MPHPWVLSLICLTLFAPIHLRAQSKTESNRLVTEKTQRSIDRGLEFLADGQHADGSFGSGTRYSRNVAVTSLCGLAFLSQGSTPGRGRYGNRLANGLKFILSRCQPNGYIVDENVADYGPMYGHGFATMFLAEIYGMTHEKSLRHQTRQKLENAVKLILATQNDEGGWRYQPEKTDADISVTVCQVMALRAARNAGIHVPKRTIQKSLEYVRGCQNRDGGFRYQLTQRTKSLFPRSAAGLVGLYSLGVYKGEEIDQAKKYLEEFRPRGGKPRYENHYYYGHYYAIQAMWLAGGNDSKRWYKAVRDEMLLTQKSDGSWPKRLVCEEYATAMSLLVLQTPNRYLPIFQR